MADETKRTMKREYLDYRHPAFEAQASRYRLWDDLSNGGEAVEGNAAYLTRHPFEPESQFTIRRERAAYTNYAAPIVTVFSSALLRKAPSRTLPPSLEALVPDVDRLGTSADVFFGDRVRRAAANGVSFVLVDMPPAPEGGSTVAADKAARRRPYFVPLNWDEVINWGLDSDGQLAWCVVKEATFRDAEPWTPRKCITRYRLWTRTTWEVWEVPEDKDSAGSLVGEGKHDLGMVPIVPFVFERKHPMVGNSSIRGVASLLLRVYRRENERDKMLFDCAVPLFFAKGFDTKDLDSFVRSSSNGITSTMPDADIKYVEPDGKAFGSLREAIQDDMRAIREVALRQIRPDSKAVESGDSKRIDNQQLNSALSRFSLTCGASETLCWQLADKWLRNSGEGVEVVYTNDFDIDQLSGDLVRSLLEVRKSRDISRETLWKSLERIEVLPDDFDPEEEAARLEEEARQGGMEGADLFGGAFKDAVRPPANTGKGGAAQ